jgi:hypothetical protein
MNVPYFASDDADTLDIINRGSDAELERKQFLSKMKQTIVAHTKFAMHSVHKSMDGDWYWAPNK